MSSKTLRRFDWDEVAVCTLLMVAALCCAPAQGCRTTAYAQQMTVTLLPRLQVFQAASATFRLTAAPYGGMAPMVFVNGMLMLRDTDYRIDGTLLTFTGQDTAHMDGPIIQVQYWVLQP